MVKVRGEGNSLAGAWNSPAPQQAACGSARPAPGPGRRSWGRCGRSPRRASLCGPGSSPWSRTRSSPQRPRLQMWAWRLESQGLLHRHLGRTRQAATDPGSRQELFLALLRIGAFGVSCWAPPPSMLEAEVSGPVLLCQPEQSTPTSPSPDVHGSPNAVPSRFPPRALTVALFSYSEPCRQDARRPSGRKALGIVHGVNAGKKRNSDALENGPRSAPHSTGPPGPAAARAVHPQFLVPQASLAVGGAGPTCLENSGAVGLGLTFVERGRSRAASCFSLLCWYRDAPGKLSHVGETAPCPQSPQPAGQPSLRDRKVAFR